MNIDTNGVALVITENLPKDYDKSLNDGEVNRLCSCDSYFDVVTNNSGYTLSVAHQMCVGLMDLKAQIVIRGKADIPKD